MNNEPVAWMLTLPDGTHDWILDGNGCEGYIPLYTHPATTPMLVLDGNCVYPSVKELPTKEDEYWLMVEMLRAKVKEQQADIDSLRMMLTNRNDALDKLNLKSTPCKYTEGM